MNYTMQYLYYNGQRYKIVYTMNKFKCDDFAIETLQMQVQGGYRDETLHIKCWSRNKTRTGCGYAYGIQTLKIDLMINKHPTGELPF